MWDQAQQMCDDVNMVNRPIEKRRRTILLPVYVAHVM